MENNLILISKLLNDFSNFIEKRSTIFLTRLNGMFVGVLEWHFELWKKEHELLGQYNMLSQWSMYSDLSRTIDSIFRQIEIRALKERAFFSFLKMLERHAEEYRNESVSSRYYVESLFGSFYQIFFQNIYDSPERYNIWEHYFPKKWKVTKNNLQNSENIIASITLAKFFEWANARVWQTGDEKNFPLDDVSRNLFPEVDPILWAAILIFVCSPYSENRLRSVIERPWNFGFMGRVKVYTKPQKEKISRIYEVEKKNAVDLAFNLFEEQFSESNLIGYIKSLEQLMYPEESLEETKRLRLKRIFTMMLDFLKGTERTDFNQSP